MISISLSKGLSSLIDDVDSDLTAYTWSAMCNGHGIFYARRNAKRSELRPRQTILLHRVIIERKLGRPMDPWDVVDHINGNALDNRRENLRLADHLANMANSKKITHRKEKPSTSRFKGVRLRMDTGKWEAYITHHQKRINLGCYATDSEAAHAYDMAAKSLFGEFANLNFRECQEARA